MENGQPNDGVELSFRSSHCHWELNHIRFIVYAGVTPDSYSNEKSMVENCTGR